MSFFFLFLDALDVCSIQEANGSRAMSKSKGVRRQNETSRPVISDTDYIDEKKRNSSVKYKSNDDSAVISK